MPVTRGDFEDFVFEHTGLHYAELVGIQGCREIAVSIDKLMEFHANPSTDALLGFSKDTLRSSLEKLRRVWEPHVRPAATAAPAAPAGPPPLSPATVAVIEERRECARIAARACIQQMRFGAANAMNIDREARKTANEMMGDRNRMIGEGMQALKWPADESMVTEDQWLSFIRVNASVCRKLEAGNCGGHASIAFLYLHEAYPDLPIAFCQVEDQHKKSGEDSHVFVAIGLTDEDGGDLNAWGDDIVICDGWMAQYENGRAGHVVSEGDFLASDYARQMEPYGYSEYASILVRLPKDDDPDPIALRRLFSKRIADAQEAGPSGSAGPPS